MAESHKRCERCQKNLAWFQLIQSVLEGESDNDPYVALCCDCLTPNEKAAIDRGRVLYREAQVSMELVGEGASI